MSKLTTVLPTSRAIRSHILSEQASDGFLSNYLSIGEFLQRAVRVDDYHRIDDDSRTLLLLEAADFKNFSTLNIERNFFTFTQNSSYLFRFFEELSGELVDIHSLDLADTYGDYAEHIVILQELYQRYQKLCDEQQILDNIFLPQKYKLNISFLKQLECVEISVLGYLTNYELELLQAASQVIPVYLRYSANIYNTKLTLKFETLGINIIENSRQRINLQTLEVDEIVAVDEKINAHVSSFSQALLQVGFVKQKVYEMIDSGIEAEKIVVVLPEERFARHLRRHDQENNFNFAMGISLSESDFVRSLDAVIQYLENSSVENIARVNRVGAELYEALYSVYKASVASLNFSSILEPFLEKEHDQAVIDIVKEELYHFEKILPVLGEASLKSALHLFVNRLKNRSIDDVRGGKITVMGLLETRLVSYDGVIVVNFNEGVVPRKSDKDLFLNSATRHIAGLPTTSERQDLQKLYYHGLFSQAQRVEISYVSSSDAVPSRFLTQLGLPLSEVQSDALYAPVVMREGVYEKLDLQEIKAHYDFRAHRLSATGLKTFLSCKRKFYYNYIEKIKAHEIAKDMPQEHEIGSALHKALQSVYEKQNSFSDIATLRKAVAEALQESNGQTVLDQYLHKLWMRKLEPFFENEIIRFKDVRVHSCEVKLERDVRGMTLYGEIDRIDSTPDGLEVLDYKSGKYKLYTLKTLQNANDFQLEFYYLLASQLGEVKSCGFYDLNSGQIIDEAVMQEKLEKLYEILDDLKSTQEYEFEMTDKVSECSYCAYAFLCQRGI